MSLKTGLVHYWNMNETSGDRLDSIGDITLAAVSGDGIGYRAGKLGNAAEFPSTNDTARLSSSDYTIEIAPGAVTVSMWVMWDAISEDGEPFFYKQDEIRFAVTTNSGLGFCHWGSNANDNALTIPVGSWAHATLWHGAGTGVGASCINDGAPASSNADPWTSNATNLLLGGTGATYITIDGGVDEVAIWNRVLTSDERTRVYNGGDGLPLSQFAPAGNQVVWMWAKLNDLYDDLVKGNLDFGLVRNWYEQEHNQGLGFNLLNKKLAQPYRLPIDFCKSADGLLVPI